jgi:peptidyl-dipeptidase Dcp
MQGIADAEGGFKIEPWDYRFYAEKVRKAKYDLDMNEVKPYLQLDKLREGMFWAAGQLYGFDLQEDHRRAGLPSRTSRVWEVTRGGKHVGLWYFDPYARGQALGRLDERLSHPGEVQGRGHHDRLQQLQLREGQARRAGADLVGRRHHPVPRVRPRPARPELGRDLSRPCPAPTWRATIVEFPSQLNEHWLPTRQVLNQFAVHYQTGKPIPRPWSPRSRRPDLQPGLRHGRVPGLGPDRHEAAPGRRRQDIDPDKFEREELAKLNMPHEIVMRHRTPQFGHVFSGDGYSAGYYSYCGPTP